ncbi:MAG: hypothetical protein M3N13_02365 [Candidatus Eremiobacteraeota bacterium]|nr:hypothetical protein [Candidatus Eremiobacteraeota bacterium]
MNEALFKVIDVNLRLTVSQEITNAYTVNSFADSIFPPIPDADKLSAA